MKIHYLKKKNHRFTKLQVSELGLTQMNRTISISAEMSTFRGAKEVQNFNLKVHSGPEGSRGLNQRKKRVFYPKFH